MILRDVRGKAFAPLGSGPLRLVSLVPSTTETLFAIGRGDDLLGYTRFCVHPADRIEPEKWIGGTKNPKIERILALQPYLVLANREENREEEIAALEAAGVPVWVAEPRTVPDAIADLRAMGTLLGREEKTERLALQIEEKVGEARARALTPRGPPLPTSSGGSRGWWRGRKPSSPACSPRVGHRFPSRGATPKCRWTSYGAWTLSSSPPSPSPSPRRTAPS